MVMVRLLSASFPVSIIGHGILSDQEGSIPSLCRSGPIPRASTNSHGTVQAAEDDILTVKKQ